MPNESVLWRFAEYFIELHGDADKRCAHGELLKASCSDVGTGAPHTAEDVLYGIFNRASCRDEDCLSFGSAIFGYAACIFIHGIARAHAVKPLENAVFGCDNLAGSLIMA